MADLASIARDVERAPEQAVRDTARAVAAAAERVGGRMRWHGRDVELGVDVRTRARGNSSTAVISGTPAGAWAIKSNGRRGGYRSRAARGSALPIGGGRFAASVTIRRGTAGDGRWTRATSSAGDELEANTARAVSRAVN